MATTTTVMVQCKSMVWGTERVEWTELFDSTSLAGAMRKAWHYIDDTDLFDRSQWRRVNVAEGVVALVRTLPFSSFTDYTR